MLKVVRGSSSAFRTAFGLVVEADIDTIGLYTLFGSFLYFIIKGISH